MYLFSHLKHHNLYTSCMNIKVSEVIVACTCNGELTAKLLGQDEQDTGQLQTRLKILSQSMMQVVSGIGNNGE